MKQAKRPTLYVDMQCPMCRVFVSTLVEEKDIAQRDIHGSGPLPLSKEQHLHAITLEDEHGTILRDVDAVAYVLRNKWWGRPLAAVLCFPGIKAVSRRVYAVIAAHRQKLFSRYGRLLMIKWLSAIGLLVGVLLSLPLWQARNTIPHVPVLVSVAPVVHMLLFGFLISFLVLTIVFPRKNLFHLGSIMLLTSLVLVDILRLQPWVYQYGLLLVATTVILGDKEHNNQQNTILWCLQLLTASIYIYAGLHKFSFAFVEQVFPWFVSSVLPASQGLIFLAWLVPVIEVLIGISLLTKTYRWLGIVGSLVMMVVVLTMIGPWGLDWNVVVWPWNIVLPATVVVLFSFANPWRLRFLRWKSFSLPAIIVVVAIVLPIGNGIGITDNYLSWVLYTGHTPSAIISNQDAEQSLQQLGFQYLRTPIYPEVRVYTDLFEQLCEQGRLPAKTRLTIEEPSRFGVTKKRQQSCLD